VCEWGKEGGKAEWRRMMGNSGEQESGRAGESTHAHKH